MSTAEETYRIEAQPVGPSGDVFRLVLLRPRSRSGATVQVPIIGGNAVPVYLTRNELRTLRESIDRALAQPHTQHAQTEDV